MKKVFYLLSVLVLFLLTSCCMEPSCPELSVDDASWFPYNDTEILSFKNFANDSIINFQLNDFSIWSGARTPMSGDECDKYCVAVLTVYSDDTFINGEDIQFTINRFEESFYVVIKETDIFLVNNFSKYSYFDLRNAEKIESDTINGIHINHLYRYTCYPEQELVAETYVKKGMGLVKIVFRNGQTFELIEYRKVN